MSIYFDNSATTKVCGPSADAVVKAMVQDYGNPSSLHGMGLDAENLVTEARKTIAGALNCNPEELYFTSGATESNNISIFGAVSANSRNGKRIVTTAIEHPSVAEPMQSLEAQGYEVVWVKPDKEGAYSAEAIAKAVDSQTVLVSCMLVNNETGTILPVEAIAKAVKRKNPRTLVHSDLVQGFGRLSFKVKKLGIDLASISGHKLYAPKGIGGLYIKKGVKVKPLILGGGQEKGIRNGTESVPLIAGFGAAVHYMQDNVQKQFNKCREIRDKLEAELAGMKRVSINSPKGGIDSILNFSVEGIRSEILLHFLEQRGIYISSGSACSKGKKSRVLKAMGLDDQRIDSAVRVSFGIENTVEEADTFLVGLQQGMDSILRSG